MKKILITGSKGRVGKDLKKLLKEYYKILELNEGDTISEDHFKGVGAVIHLAALTPNSNKKRSLQSYIETNVSLTKQILNYSIKYNIRIVIIPTSWSWIFRIGSYQYSKLLQEKVANKYKTLGLNVVLLEFPEVIHERYTGVVSAIQIRLGTKSRQLLIV